MTSPLLCDKPTYLLAEWSRYATCFSPSSNHRPSRNTAALAASLFRYRYNKQKRQQNIQPAEVSVSCVSLLSDGKSVLPYFFRDSQARLLVNESLSVSLKLSAGGRVWLIRVSGTVLYCYRSGFEMHTLQARSVDLLFLFFIVSRSVLLLEFDTH